MDSKDIPNSKILDCSIRFSKQTTGRWGSCILKVEGKVWLALGEIS